MRYTYNFAFFGIWAILAFVSFLNLEMSILHGLAGINWLANWHCWISWRHSVNVSVWWMYISAHVLNMILISYIFYFRAYIISITPFLITSGGVTSFSTMVSISNTWYFCFTIGCFLWFVETHEFVTKIIQIISLFFIGWWLIASHILLLIMIFHFLLFNNLLE